MRRDITIITLTLAVVLAACGGSDGGAAVDSSGDDTPVVGSEPPATDAPEANDAAEPTPTDGGDAAPEPTPRSDIVSSDGVLRISEPPDGVEITIGDATPLELPEGAAGTLTVLGGYDLGPDGTTFDPPLVVDIAVPDSADLATDGFGVVHVHDDGTTEWLEATFTDDGFRVALDSFSSVHVVTVPESDAAVVLRAPDRAVVGGLVVASLQLERLTQAGSELDDVTGAEGAWSASGALAVDLVDPSLGFGVASLSCTVAGPGSVRYLGPLRVDLSWPDDGSDDHGGEVVTDTEEADTDEAAAEPGIHFREARADAEIECLAATTIEPSDTRFFDGTTGADVESFITAAELMPTFWVDPATSTLSAQVTIPADASTAFGIGGRTGDGTTRYVETRADGAFGFFGSGFAPFEPTPDFSTVEIVDGGDDTSTVTVTVSIPCGSDGTTRVFPGGLPGNGGDPIGPVDVTIVDVTFFVQDAGGDTGVFFFDPTGPLGELEGFSTCP